jgi:hypothetical protein
LGPDQRASINSFLLEDENGIRTAAEKKGLPKPQGQEQSNHAD